MTSLRPTLALTLPALALPALALLGLCAAACQSPQHLPARAQRTLAPQLDLPAGIRKLDVQFHDGLLTLESGPRLACTLEIHLCGDDDAALDQLAARVAPRLARDDDGGCGLHVEMPAGADPEAVRTTWRLVAPSDMTVAVQTRRGAVVARGARCKLEVRGGSGVVEAEMAGGAAQLATGSGSLMLRGDYSTAEVHSDLGRIDVQLPDRGPLLVDVRATSRKGDVYIDVPKEQAYDFLYFGEERLVHSDPEVRVQWIENVTLDGADYLQGRIGDLRGAVCGQIRLDALGPVYVRLQPEAAVVGDKL